MKVIVFGFFLHLVFLLSVFDIYFKSPIISDIPVQKTNVQAPAKRLVLFVADGLRAESMFAVNSNDYLAPYLRSVIESRGAWGVAHSRVPTESRPGHIALIAGFYEDPSAVFTGWKDNLVEFDSVFNRSHVTYSWGSPDILPMFKKGATENKVHTHCYDADEEDFSGHGSTKLNTWVFDRVERFLQSAKEDSALGELLNSPGVVLFLHLLGPDVAGHASKPHSREYKENINVVDNGVEVIERLLNEFYGHDNKTAFVFTSDHGMTDWGSHGAGSASETEVPLVVWGAGVTGPRPSAAPSAPQTWHLSHLHRVDVAQADVCTLMATLIGVPIPVHSVGVLPLELLSVSANEKATMLLHNADQLSAQFSRKRATVEASLLAWLYTPFPGLTRDREAALRHNITELSQQGKHDDAVEETQELIRLSHWGLDYYHSYFQGLLLSCVSMSFLGWITWLLCLLLRPQPENESKGKITVNNGGKRKVQVYPDVIFLLLTAATIYLIHVQSLPAQFYIYCCLPLHLWWNVLRQLPGLRNVLTKHRPLHIIAAACLTLLLLQLLVMTFYQRWVLSLAVVIVSLWPFSLRDKRKLLPLSVQLLWFVVFVCLAVFPALPVVGRQTKVGYVVLCGALWLVLGVVCLCSMGRSKCGWVLPTQLLMLINAIGIVYATAIDFERGLGLLTHNQIAAWTLLLGSMVAPLWTENEVPLRLLSLGLGLSTPFLLLCVGHEAFFFLALFIALCLWLVVESYLSEVKISHVKFEEYSKTYEAVSRDDFRKCFFFLMFILLSFFGTGNIASINSFDLSWLRCFLTVFSPFTMTALILLKTVIPFLLVTCCFRAINTFSKVRPEHMFIIVLIYCDVMGLQFLFAVTTRGSWLEIGTSVSHFVIMEVTTLFLAALYWLARLYTDTVLGGVERKPDDNPIFPLWLPPNKNHPD